MTAFFEEGINIGKALAGTHALVTHVGEMFQEIAQQFKFKHVGSCEIGMTTLGIMRLVGRAVPDEKSFAQTGAGSNDRDGPLGDWLTLIYGMQVVRFQVGNGVRNRIQVVEQAYRRDMQPVLELLFVHFPGKIGDGGVPFQDWTSHSKTGVIYRDVLLRQVCLYQRLKTWIVSAGKSSLMHRIAPACTFFMLKKSEVGFRSSNITHE